MTAEALSLLIFAAIVGFIILVVPLLARLLMIARGYRPCKRCDGIGMIAIYNDWIAGCPECDGTGWRKQ